MNLSDDKLVDLIRPGMIAYVNKVLITKKYERQIAQLIREEKYNDIIKLVAEGLMEEARKNG